MNKETTSQPSFNPILVLREKLLSATIGFSQGNERLGDETVEAFREYAVRALGGNILIENMKLLNSKVSLNSIMASATIMINGEKTNVFLKVHLESGAGARSVLGDSKEYVNAQLLAGSGWPVLSPLMKNTDPAYPLLVYPLVTTTTMFELIELSYDKKKSMLTNRGWRTFTDMQKKIGTATISSLQKNMVVSGVEAPVQTLFWERFKNGGRIDNWYSDETLFALPNTESPISWKVLKNALWNINGRLFENTVQQIIDSARKTLSFIGETDSYTVISHCDDHAGNLFLDQNTSDSLVFDPAFAGINPIALSDTKALAHIGYMIPGGMYFNPKIASCSYRYDTGTNTVFTEIDFKSSPFSVEHEKLARIIIDERIIPLFTKAKKLGASIPKEIQRLKNALSACPLLTINIPKLLDTKDGRGIGLLPLVLIMNEMKGFESLEYLEKQLWKLK